MWPTRSLRAVPGLLVGGIVLVLAGCDDSTGPAAPPNPVDPATPPHVVATYPPDGGSGPFEVHATWDDRQPHFVVVFDKLIDRDRFSTGWFRAEGFTEALRFELADESSTPRHTDVLAVRIFTQGSYMPKDYEIGRTYAVTVDTTLRDLTGNRLQAPYRFSFVPEPHFRVVKVSFHPGEPVPPLALLQVQFNGELDPGSWSALELEPDIPGSWVPYKNSRGVAFAQSQPFAFGTTYTLRIAATAMDTQGHRLPEPFTTTFDVRGFEIEAAYPSNGTIQFPPSNPLAFRVTGPVDTTTLAEAVRLEPATSGRFAAGAATFAFYPDDDLQPSTRYDVSVSTALHAWDGTPLSTPYAFSFTTDEFRVSETEPSDGTTRAPVEWPISVRFNMHLDPATTAAAFSIAPEAAGSIQVRAPERLLVFTPEVALEYSTTYTVTISTALRASNGAPFPQSYTFSFTTAPPR